MHIKYGGILFNFEIIIQKGDRFMKKYLLLIFLSIPIYSFSQTEVWRQNGYSLSGYLDAVIISEGNGNIYLARKNRADTLKKINSMGTVVNQIEIPALKQLIKSKEGFYALFWGETWFFTTIAYYDTSLTRLWERSYWGNVNIQSAVDSKGNLIILDPILHFFNKYSPTGELIFERAVPRPVDSYGKENCTMYVDASDNIWFVLHSITSPFHSKYGYVHVYRFNSGGNLYPERDIKITRQIVWTSITGSITEIEWPYLTKAITSNDKLILAGTYYKSKEHSNQRITIFNYFSEGRLINVNNKGFVKRFNLKGNGKYICNGDWYRETSNGENFINDLTAGKGGSVYVVGTLSRGLATCDSNLHTDGFIMKYNTNKHKIEWRNIIPDRKPGVAFFDPTRGIIVTFPEFIRVYDPSGSSRSNTYQFYDEIRAFPRWINNEPGYIYLFMKERDSQNYYLAKYLLPQSTFTENYSFAETDDETVVDEYHLYQNYPNPFNSSTSIKYSLPADAFTTIKVFNLLGEEIVTLVDEIKDEGSHEVTFDAPTISAELPSGVYFFRISAVDISNPSNKFTQTKKLLLLK